MEAVLSPRGQLTIPISLRRMLGLCGGDKVVIDKSGDGIVIRNAGKSQSMKALEEFQKGMEGAAAEAGWTCEQDVVDYCKEIRREMWEERYANNA